MKLRYISTSLISSICNYYAYRALMFAGKALYYPHYLWKRDFDDPNLAFK